MQRKNNLQRQGIKQEVVKLKERFTYYPYSQTIKDNYTSERYNGNQKTTDILNQLNNQLEQIPENIRKVWIQ